MKDIMGKIFNSIGFDYEDEEEEVEDEELLVTELLPVSSPLSLLQAPKDAMVTKARSNAKNLTLFFILFPPLITKQLLVPGFIVRFHIRTTFAFREDVEHSGNGYHIVVVFFFLIQRYFANMMTEHQEDRRQSFTTDTIV